jgi:outer membrane murein-binding lipoprotein Lpp
MLKSIGLLIVAVLCLGLAGCATTEQKNQAFSNVDRNRANLSEAKEIANSINNSATATSEEKANANGYVTYLELMQTRVESEIESLGACTDYCSDSISNSNAYVKAGEEALGRIKALQTKITNEAAPIDTTQQLQNLQNQQQQNNQIQIQGHST